MVIERTLAMIKPDGVANNHIGKIFTLIEDSGFQIIAAKMIHLSKTDAERFYTEHKDRPFYEPLLRFMTSGPVMVEILEGENIIQSLRNLMGATAPKEAAKGTIRHLYADHDFKGDVYENVIHGSDGVENAKREIDFFFTQDEICPRTR